MKRKKLSTTRPSQQVTVSGRKKEAQGDAVVRHSTLQVRLVGVPVAVFALFENIFVLMH
jgi:hypothetical protein